MITAPDPIDDFSKYDEPRLHMERLMKAKLVEFDIPIHILLPLDGAGIKTIGDIVSRTRSDLLSIRRLSPVAVRRIEVFLSHHLLSLNKKGCHR